jgi:lambda family phage portal protein
MGILNRLFTKEQPEEKTVYKFLRMRENPSYTKQNNIRGFSSGESNRLFDSWFAPETSIDSILKQELTRIRSRCRERTRNDDYVKGFIRTTSNNVLGSNGVELEPKVKKLNGNPDDLANQNLLYLWKSWGKKAENVDITHYSNWIEIQQHIMNVYLTDGEVFIRHIEGKEAGQWGYSIQVIDPELCDTQLNHKLNNGNEIVMGVELDKWRRPVAYHFKTDNKGVGAVWTENNKSYLRIPEREITHAFKREYPEQTRGVPVLASTLNRLKMLDSYEEAALVNARYGAEVVGNYYRDGDGYDPADGQGSIGELTQSVEVGQIGILPDTWKFEKIDTKYPDGELPEFVKHMLRSVSASLGIPYFLMAQDLAEVNYSTARVGLEEAKVHWRNLQLFMIEKVVAPIYEKWLFQQILRKKIVLAGRVVGLEELDRFANVGWVTHKWVSIDPQKDANADKLYNEMGIKSKQTISERLGLDYEMEQARLKKEQPKPTQNNLTDTYTQEEADNEAQAST